ncbi:hypothetical protein BDF20DRAFT_836008 [Mycotypha africana]|uniref:uncharacterized protein n=1 Tax=Mycotypha africana TaxID=64632 RepID=UPI0023008DD3|nr:uncharacterized protein BDF20DRAFT_836008 [Mycotypha africana]KAI8977186.1 hypothetical protein BDF20DRAFT_836008 [Mycotypha africana]
MACLYLLNWCLHRILLANWVQNTEDQQTMKLIEKKRGPNNQIPLNYFKMNDVILKVSGHFSIDSGITLKYYETYWVFSVTRLSAIDTGLWFTGLYLWIIWIDLRVKLIPDTFFRHVDNGCCCQS